MDADVMAMTDFETIQNDGENLSQDPLIMNDADDEEAAYFSDIDQYDDEFN
jgi:hypothetical protein